MSRDRRNCHVGNWAEVVDLLLDPRFTVDSLRRLLVASAAGSPAYTHPQIADWTRRFASACDSAVERAADLALAADVAEDVDAQWGLRLANMYPRSILQTPAFSTEAMPQAWFENWLDHLGARYIGDTLCRALGYIDQPDHTLLPP